MKLENSKGKEISLQVSVIGNIKNDSDGFFSTITGEPFLVKNITNENITAEVQLASSNFFIETVFYPGWNPELILKIKWDKDSSLQYGY